MLGAVALSPSPQCPEKRPPVSHVGTQRGPPSWEDLGWIYRFSLFSSRRLWTLGLSGRTR